MKAPLSLRIRTEKGDKIYYLLLGIIWIIYIVDEIALIVLKNLFVYLLLLSSFLVTMTVLFVLVRPLDLRLTPKKLILGKFKLPLKAIRELRISNLRHLKGNYVADLTIVYDSGALTVSGVKNWRDVLETYQRYSRENK
ncbi:hypothetical protein HS7_14570 [Sulfolobales archaeon HS-7]|nr:hypothetical protein HS7_14570 [Sulfolobales archaeon HS-7]